MAAVVYIFALFLFLPLSKQDSVDVYLNSVLNSIEKIVEFYHSDFKNLNVDGLYGLRVLEGHIGQLVTIYQNGSLQHLNKRMVDSMALMKEKATQICNLATQHVKKDAAEYFRQMSFVVESPWDMFDNVHRKISKTWKWSPEQYTHAKKSVSLDEETSDKCMSELIGSHKSHGDSCDISKDCVHLMTQRGLVGYGITHQVLWTMLAEKAGCRGKLEKLLKSLGEGDLTSLRDEFCSNNYIQLHGTLDRLPDRVILPSLQDLFLEQLFICPSLGYYQFLELDYIPTILSWQLEDGCFGKMKKPSVKLDKDDKWRQLVGSFTDDYVDEDDDDNEPGLTLNQIIKGKVDKKLKFKKDENFKLKGGNQVKEWEMPKNKGRKLLVEKTMSGNCLAHKTAVASGALVIYLRYLSQPDAAITFSVGRTQRSTLEHSRHGHSSPKPVLNPPRVIQDNNVQINSHTDNRADNKANINANNVNTNLKLKDLNKALDRTNKETGRNNNVKEQNREQVNQNVREMVASDNNQLAVNNKIEKDSYKYDDEYDHNNEGKKAGNIEDNVEIVNRSQRQVKDNNGHYAVNDDDNEEEEEEDDDYDDDDEYNDEEDEDEIGNYPANRADTGDYHIQDQYDEERDKTHSNVGGYVDDNKQDVETDYNKDVNDEKDGHPHIHGRNIGNAGSRDYDGKFDRNNNGDAGKLHQVKDYDDDEEGDDYAYDDDKDEGMEERRQEELRDGFILAKSDSESQESRHNSISQPETVSYTSVFVLFAICIGVVFIIYRCLRRRRIRLRVGHKYFHV